MAYPVTIDRVRAQGLRVVFDTNILIDAIQEPDGGPIKRAIADVPLGNRFVTSVVLWEFICHRQIHGRTRASRRDWLKNRQLSQIHDPSPQVFSKLRELIASPGAQGAPADAILAAMALVDEVAIATNNLRDYCWHGKIAVVSEFITTSTTPLDCSA